MKDKKSEKKETTIKICPGCGFNKIPKDEEMCPKCRSNGIVTKSNKFRVF